MISKLYSSSVSFHFKKAVNKATFSTLNVSNASRGLGLGIVLVLRFESGLSYIYLKIVMNID